MNGFAKKTCLAMLAALPAFWLANCAGSADAAAEKHCATRFTIMSPYAGIDWDAYGQYKAALHAHTTRSDGRNTLAEMVEEHFAQGFDILAITDHNIACRGWANGADALTQERLNEIAEGAGRGGRGMLRIPFANEQSRGQHLNTFFADFTNARGATLRSNAEKTERLGGLSHINHPGRYTGGRMPGRLGAGASGNRRRIRNYAALFMEFPSLVGMEIVNKKDGQSTSDRILWDNILRETVPQGRFVWGFSNDDSHSAGAIGYSFNIFVMPSNTLENFRDAMKRGSFYAVARVARRELGRSFVGSGPFPAIRSVTVDEGAATIAIAAAHYTRIDWIYAGSVVAQGSSISLACHQRAIGSYVRANIIGPGGISFTQPFGIARQSAISP